SFVHDQMGHACEWEKSLMLRIWPELVGVYKAVAALPEVYRLRPAHRAWITKVRSEPGHIGLPSHASAEKGELLFRLFAEDVTAFLERVVAWDSSSEIA